MPSSVRVANGAPCVYKDFLHELVRKSAVVLPEFLVLPWKRLSTVEMANL
jgi:hypothetical protein